MALRLKVTLIPDPDGHDEALLLKGDWLIVALSDGTFVGLGEASHSGDDGACVRQLDALFDEYVRHMDLSLSGIRTLERGPFAAADNRTRATAISALNQALYDLLARQNHVPVWRLFVDRPVQGSLPMYATINRALIGRTEEDYVRAVDRALSRGFRQVKCAPFEAVRGEGDQVQAAKPGLSILRRLRSEFPGLDLRVDFHKRFSCHSFLRVLPEIGPIGPHWIEEPCPIDECYKEIRGSTSIPIAAGELFFGTERFIEIASRGWADVVMPDVKHVGGFGPFIDVCRAVAPKGVEISPHNPAGPVATLASLHVAAVSPTVTSLEMAMSSSDGANPLAEFVEGDSLRIPDGPGWGLDVDSLMALLTA
jgi:galactonate dehydratase